jgi:hypothetical protein
LSMIYFTLFNIGHLYRIFLRSVFLIYFFKIFYFLVVILITIFKAEFFLYCGISLLFIWALYSLSNRCRHGRDRIIVGFTTTYAISAFHHWCYEFESRSGRGVQHYVIMFVSFLRQVGGFLRVHRFPQPIKFNAHCAFLE